jgi:hypothetical protein
MPYGKAHENVQRSVHPDMVRAEDGTLYLRSDVYEPQSVADRELNREMQDPARREHRMRLIADWQARQPQGTAEAVAGQEFPGSYAEGERQYLARVREENELTARMAGKSVYVDDEAIRRMSLEQYDQYFDANGHPKDHVYYHANRSRRVDDSGVDAYTERELRR